VTVENTIPLPHWLQSTLALGGGLGLFVIAFLDSSVLPLPVINDLILIDLSVRNHARMPYYALMSVVGSVLGCVALFFVAKKGGEAYFRKYAGPRSDKIRKWVQENEFLTVLVGALMPPPTPFKLVVLGSGAFNMSFRNFVVALTLARVIRYFGLGFLAVRYGDQATQFLMQHKVSMSLVILGTVLLFYVIVKLALRPKNAAV
jgi:membrane protein YqaA with SNARE-associated domain